MMIVVMTHVHKPHNDVTNNPTYEYPSQLPLLYSRKVCDDMCSSKPTVLIPSVPHCKSKDDRGTKTREDPPHKTDPSFSDEAKVVLARESAVSNRPRDGTQ